MFEPLDAPEHFPAGPKAPPPVNAGPCWHWQYNDSGGALWACACRAFSTFYLPPAIAAALRERLKP